jgi:hypothetical protein
MLHLILLVNISNNTGNSVLLLLKLKSKEANQREAVRQTLKMITINVRDKQINITQHKRPADLVEANDEYNHL